MIIYDPKITGSFEVNGSSLSSLESIDNVSGSVVDLTAASASFSTRVSDQESFSSSLDATFATDADLNLVSSSVDSLNAASSSYALENSISGSFTSTSSSLASELLKNTTDTLTGDLTVTGTLTAQDLHVQEVTSSIVFSSGSNKFGENVSDTQKFTGSLQVSGSIDLEDNAKINIGTGNDLQIYHDGSNSFIKDVGTGILAIDTNGTDVRITKTDSEFMAKFVTDAEVQLYYDNSLKFETTTTGVDVTGDITIDAGKKLAYSSTAFMTPENNVTGAEISTPGDFRIKTGTSPTLALTLGGSQDATFTSTVQIGDGSVTNLSLGANSSDFELSAKKNGTDAISMVFKTQASGGTLSEAMRITSGGDVGINYSGPFNQISSTETTLAISNSNIASLYLNNTHSNGHRWILTSGTDGAFGFYDKTEGATRMVIDSSGHVGIGITPNVNSTVVNVIQLGKGMTLMGNANDDRATMAANLYLDTGTAFRYVMDGLAGRFSIEDGNMIWGTAGSGTAGTVATVDTKMTLLNNGNVGINTTSPSYKLEVNGGAALVGGGFYVSSDQAVITTSTYTFRDGVYINNPNSTSAAVSSNSVMSIGASSGNSVNTSLITTGAVGIGTNSPDEKLDVAGKVQVTGTSLTVINASDPVITVSDTDTNYRGSMRWLSSSNVLEFFTRYGGTYYTNNLVLDRGNVGIGETSPNGKLDIKQDMTAGTTAAFTNPHLRLSANNTVDSTGFVGMTFATSTADNYGFSWGALRTVSALGGMHLRYHGNSASGTDIFNIDYVGNVTIPSTRLIRSDSSAGYLIIQGGATYPGGRVEMYGGSNAAAGIIFSTGTTTTSPAERMRIDSSGNVNVESGRIRIAGGGSDSGTQLNLWSDSNGYCFIAGYQTIFNQGNNNSRSEVMRITSTGLGIGTTSPEQKLHVEGRGIFDGGTSSDILQIRNDNGGGVFGMTSNLFALDLASTSAFRIRQGSTVPLYLKSDGNLGIGITTPQTNLQVNGSPNAIVSHFGPGTFNANGTWSGISLGYSEAGNAGYRKVGIAAQTKGDSAARQDLHFLVDTATDSNSVNITDSKMMIAHDTGYVGIATAAPAAPLHVHGNIQSKEGIISPTFYVARNYGSVSGNFAGYDDITEGDIINLVDHSIGSLNAFAHGQLDPIINGSSDSIDWNYFRLLFRYTNNSATYTNYTVGFKVARYFYSAGWTENSAEFSGNGMDGARGPRWAVSPWTTLGGIDVPGIGLKYYDNYTHTQTIRVHAIYIQYKS